MRKTLIVVAVLILAACIVLKVVSFFGFGLGIDLPIPTRWIMHPPIMFFVVLGIFVLGIFSAAGWILFRRMRWN